ncbi:MAG: alkaline phosphatase family protein [Sphingobium sp.]|nr:MAG: alkaline phosphatase family protein [Sphingobium sp.]
MKMPFRPASMLSRLVGLALFSVMTACAPMAVERAQAPAPIPASHAASADVRPPITVLLSIDGFRPAILRHGLTPNLDALAAEGVSGDMRPVFPANTFPNHVSLVTGQRPDHHGIVDNAMRDPRKPGVTWKITDPLVNRDGFWWEEAEPVWVSAERAGIRTGVLYWPGSDNSINGTRPSIWFPYDAAITSAQRVDTALDWARRPAATRPAFIAVYFDVVDKADHHDGFDSAQEHAAIADVDAQIGRLRAGLADMGQPANLIVVSDHGMAPVPPEHVRPITDIVDPAIMEAITEGPWLDIYPLADKDAAVAAALLRSHDNIDCWRREDVPARYAYGRNPRVAPFLCMAHVGWTFVKKPRAFTKGEHGFDPAAPEMRALFLAAGPAFRRGLTLPTFDNIDVYPLLARLVGLPPRPVDGNPATLDVNVISP